MIYFHKFMFIFISIVGLIWTCIALETAPFQGGFWDTVRLTYITAGSIAWWGGAYILGMQFVYIRFVYKNKLLRKYAVSIQKDIVVSLIAAIMLASIYWLDSVDYSFNGIDLGFIGVPFGIASFYAVFQLFGVKIAGEKLVCKPLFITLIFLTVSYLVICYLLLENLGGTYSTAKALWVQITVLCFSFVMFLNTHLMLFFAQEGRLAIPEFQSSVLKGFNNDADSILKEMEQPVQQANKMLEVNKAKYSASLRRKTKK